MPHRTALYLLTSVVALATGLALLGTAMTFGAPRVADPGSRPTEAVARAFYAAVNESIRGGDGAALDAIVADNVTIAGSVGFLARDRAELARYLASVHTLTPGLELVVERVVAVQNRAIVHLAVRGGGEAGLLGNPLHGGPLSWGVVEAVEVAGGRVVEYWSGASGALLWEPMGQTGFPMAAPVNRIVTLDRLLIPPGGVFTARQAYEDRLLIGEAGSVMVTAPLIDLRELLSGGDFLALPTRSPIEVRNAGQTPASLLVLAAARAAPTGSEMDPSYPLEALPDIGSTTTIWQGGQTQVSGGGGQVAPLAGVASVTLPAMHPVVTVGRLTLAPGTRRLEYETSGPNLLVVEQGTLGIEADEDSLWIRRGATGHSRTLDSALLAASDGTILDAGMTVVLDNPGPEPVVVTLVAILPGDAVEGGSTTSERHEG